MLSEIRSKRRIFRTLSFVQKQIPLTSLSAEARINGTAYYVLHRAHDDPVDMDENTAVSKFKRLTLILFLSPPTLFILFPKMVCESVLLPEPDTHVGRHVHIHAKALLLCNEVIIIIYIIL